MDTKSMPVAANGISVQIDQPVVLEQNGNPVAVLISVSEFERYQKLRSSQSSISASQAQRAANRRVFGDLVGCALACGEPVWIPNPKPHWHVPYRLFDGTLAQVVEVDGLTGEVSLTNERRDELLQKVATWAAHFEGVTLDVG